MTRSKDILKFIHINLKLSKVDVYHLSLRNKIYTVFKFWFNYNN